MAMEMTVDDRQAARALRRPRVAKDSVIDRRRLNHLEVIDVGGVAIGDVPLDAFTIQHAERAMQRMPESAKRPATRRQYAQLLHRVLALAVYPCRHIAANPLPKGFMPKVGKPPGFTYLRPSEDAALMRCKPVPLCWRVLFDFLSRKGEPIGFQVRDFDLEAGAVRLDENKTDSPRSWALDRGVVRALKAWVDRRDANPSDHMFVDEGGNVLTDEHRMSDVRRAARRRRRPARDPSRQPQPAQAPRARPAGELRDHQARERKDRDVERRPDGATSRGR